MGRDLDYDLSNGACAIASATAVQCGAKARLPSQIPKTGEQRHTDEMDELRAHLQDGGDALGDVVRGEAEHQESPEPRRARCECGADGKTFAEIVQPDAEGDIGRKRKTGR